MDRRGFITGLISLVAAPAIVRAGSLMPVKRIWFAPDKIYVDGEAIVAGNGSSSRPFSTLQQAFDWIGGDMGFDGRFVTVQIAPGTYKGARFSGPSRPDLLLNGSIDTLLSSLEL